MSSRTDLVFFPFAVSRKQSYAFKNKKPEQEGNYGTTDPECILSNPFSHGINSECYVILKFADNHSEKNRQGYGDQGNENVHRLIFSVGRESDCESHGDRQVDGNANRASTSQFMSVRSLSQKGDTLKNQSCKPYRSSCTHSSRYGHYMCSIYGYNCISRLRSQSR